MTDRFGRQKSKRWVNSVPTYGDWGDDEYDYYDEDEDRQSVEDGNQQNQKKVTPQKFELPSDHVPPLPVVDLNQAQNIVRDSATTTQFPDSDQQPTNLVLSIDKKEPDDGVLTNEGKEENVQMETPQAQLKRNSFYEPEVYDSEEPPYTEDDTHPLSSLGQPGLRLSIYRKDIKSEEEIFDGLPEEHHDDANSIRDETKFGSVNELQSERDLNTNGSNIYNQPQPSLVLSVDKGKNIYSDSSDDDMNGSDSDDVRSEVGFNETVDQFQKSSLKSNSNTPTIDTRNTTHTFRDLATHNKNFQPPTPTYSFSNQGSIPPESPSVASETSFNSEYSFQKEPASLHLATHHEVVDPPQEQEQELEPQQEPKPEPESKSETVNVNAITDLEQTKTITKQDQSGLVLSVDKPNNDDDDDDDDDDTDDDGDDWGYHSQCSSNDEYENEALDVPHDSQPDIDSFINELNNSSGGDRSDEILPPLNHDVSLPDFENTSFSKYDEDPSHQEYDNYHEDDDVPIRPLSISQAKEAHDDYLNSLSGRRQSVRKPPRQSVVFSDDLAGIIGGYSESASEKESETTKNIQEDVISEHLKDPIEEEPQKESLDLAPPGLYPVISSGSLSTGRLSMDTANNRLSMDTTNNRLSIDTTTQRAPEGSEEFLPKDVRDSRRISTLSNSTFNLGGWAPNTDRFRSQFINDNDSESINYNPEKSTNDNFSKLRNTSSSLAEEISNSSSLSVPETIDAAMPSIQEDTISEDEQDNEDADKVEEFHGESHSINPTMTMSSYNDSVLGDNHFQKPLFQEERFTPAASREDLLPQKYHSLIPPDSRKASDSSETTERERSTSTSTVKSDNTVQVTPKVTSPPALTQGKYPVSDWKSIVTISQPIDRIAAFRLALVREQQYDSGIQGWLNYALKQQPSTYSHLLIGRVASQAYQNAPHNDLRRHASLRSKVNIVKDKVEGTTGSFGKKLFSRSRKFIKSNTSDK